MTTLAPNPARTTIRASRRRVADQAIISAYIHEITPRQTVTAQTEDPAPEPVLRAATAVDTNGHAARFRARRGSRLRRPSPALEPAA